MMWSRPLLDFRQAKGASEPTSDLELLCLSVRLGGSPVVKHEGDEDTSLVKTINEVFT